MLWQSCSNHLSYLVGIFTHEKRSTERTEGRGQFRLLGSEFSVPNKGFLISISKGINSPGNYLAPLIVAMWVWSRRPKRNRTGDLLFLERVPTASTKVLTRIFSLCRSKLLRAVVPEAARGDGACFQSHLWYVIRVWLGTRHDAYQTLSQQSIPITRNQKKQAVLVTPCKSCTLSHHHISGKNLSLMEKVGNEQPSWHHPRPP